MTCDVYGQLFGPLTGVRAYDGSLGKEPFSHFVSFSISTITVREPSMHAGRYGNGQI